MVRSALVSLALLAAASTAAQVPTAEPAAEAPPGAPATSGATPAPAAAPAADRDAPPGRIGLGVALGASGILPAIYMPVDVEGARVELEFGYEGSTDSDAGSALRAGLGLFSLVPATGDVRGYGGVRLRYLRAEDAGTAAAAALRVAAALGGEWVPHPSVAIGAEAQLGYSWFSEPANASDRIDATAQAFLRVFTSFGEPGPRPAPAAAGPRSGVAAPAPAPAPPRPRPRPRPLVRCQTKADCEGLEICYEGYCRR